MNAVTFTWLVGGAQHYSWQNKSKKNNNFWLITCFPIDYLIWDFQQPYATVGTGIISSILQIG